MNTLRRILLVEDDPRDIELTLAALKQNNLSNEVVVAHDGVEALEYLRYQGLFQERERGNPVVILLDLKLPRVDGFQVLRDIRADAALKMIPVCVLTSSREERDLMESYNHGVNAYVVKPVDFIEFTKAIKAVGLFWAVLNEPPPTR